MHAAARDGDTVTIGTLLSSTGAQSLINTQDADGATALNVAALNGHEAVTEQFIAARCDVDLQNNHGIKPIYAAAQNGYAAVTKQLIEARCNMDLQEELGCTSL